MSAPIQTANPRITIELNIQTGQIELTGPLENMSLFLGMLETAKVILIESRATANQSAIAKPPPGLVLTH